MILTRWFYETVIRSYIVSFNCWVGNFCSRISELSVFSSMRGIGLVIILLSIILAVGKALDIALREFGL